MFSAQLPKRLSQFSRSFVNTDGTAWIVALAGVATAALICAAFFLD